MRSPLVNVLALIASATFISVACSNADGHGARSGTKPPMSAASNSSVATDSLAKEADASRIEGSPSAKLWVIEVSDFQCPYCKEWHDETYSTVLNDYVKTGKVRLAYVNFPLSMHQHAHEAAIAAMCAGAQGKFWPMHDALFASQNKWEGLPSATAAFDSLAASVGVDQAKYKSCLTSPSIAALVAGDQDRARQGGVQSTPSFWVGGRFIEGAIPKSQMTAVIDSALAAAK